jgi:hypothetical protein
MVPIEMLIEIFPDSREIPLCRSPSLSFLDSNHVSNVVSASEMNNVCNISRYLHLTIALQTGIMKAKVIRSEQPTTDTNLQQMETSKEQIQLRLSSGLGPGPSVILKNLAEVSWMTSFSTSLLRAQFVL